MLPRLLRSPLTRLFLLALVLRLIPVLLAYRLPIGLDDMFQYDMLGRSLAAGEGFRWYAQPDLDLIRSYIDLELVGDYDPRGVLTSFRAPGYPAFLALVYTLSGLSWRFFAARLVQAALGASLAPLSYALARRLFPENEKTAAWAGLAMAVYPMLVIYPLAIATETIFIPLVTAGLLALLVAAEKGQARYFVLAGALFGYATLTRSVVFAFVGLAFLWLLLAAKERRGALVFLLAVFLLVAPWSLRNTLLHDEFTFVESSLGYNLHMGYHPQGRGSFQYGISLELLPYIDDGQRNELGMAAGLGFIRVDPGRVPVLMLNKLGFFFGLERRALEYFYSNNFFGHIPGLPLSALYLLFTLPFAAVSLLASLALPFVRWNKERALLLLFVGGYLLPHVLLLSEDRFHLAVVPVLAVFAAHAWSSRRQLWTRARSERPRLVLVLVLAALLCLNWGLELSRDADKLIVLFGANGNQSYFPY
jgi:4-amino-4-deoxy-L-arabinose transferase-like glycosyltransferase